LDSCRLPIKYEGWVFALTQNYPPARPDPKEVPEVCARNFEEIKIFSLLQW
jgi:hypothetical protein